MDRPCRSAGTNSRILRRLVCVGGALALLLFFIILVLSYFAREKSVLWGLNFSSKYFDGTDLSWQEAYETILTDFHPRAVRIAAYWDELEPYAGAMHFQELDWQMDLAEEHGVRVILAVGMKTPQWPECHIPAWAWGISTQDRESALREYIRRVVKRYRDHPALWRWQVENEPNVVFGICPERPVDFLQKEIAVVRMLDGTHAIVGNPGSHGSSGLEAFSKMYSAASLSDILAVNIYTKLPEKIEEDDTFFQDESRRFFFFAADKEGILRMRALFPSKKIIATEVQAEPWGSLEFSARDFMRTVRASCELRLSEYFFWGAESWYTLRQQGEMRIWRIAQYILREGKCV